MPAIAAALGGLGFHALAFGGMLAASVMGMVLAGRSCDCHGALRATVAGLAVFGIGLLVAGVLFSLTGEHGAQGHALVLAPAASLAVVGALLGRRAFEQP